MCFCHLVKAPPPVICFVSCEHLKKPAVAVIQSVHQQQKQPFSQPSISTRSINYSIMLLRKREPNEKWRGIPPQLFLLWYVRLILFKTPTNGEHYWRRPSKSGRLNDGLTVTIALCTIIIVKWWTPKAQTTSTRYNPSFRLPDATPSFCLLMHETEEMEVMEQKPSISISGQVVNWIEFLGNSFSCFYLFIYHFIFLIKIMPWEWNFQFAIAV